MSRPKNNALSRWRNANTGSLRGKSNTGGMHSLDSRRTSISSLNSSDFELQFDSAPRTARTHSLESRRIPLKMKKSTSAYFNEPRSSSPLKIAVTTPPKPPNTVQLDKEKRRFLESEESQATDDTSSQISFSTYTSKKNQNQNNDQHTEHKEEEMEKKEQDQNRQKTEPRELSKSSSQLRISIPFFISITNSGEIPIPISPRNDRKNRGEKSDRLSTSSNNSKGPDCVTLAEPFEL